MDSSYSAISKNSYVELQKQNKFLPLDDEEKSFVNNGHALDPDPSGSNQGSGISGAVFNLTTSIIGAGIMALPATMKVLGLVLGLLLILLIAILSEISVELLVRFSALNNSRSYGEVVESALGKPARVFSEICIVVNNGGFLVVYLIIMGDVMSGSLHHVGVLDQWLGNGFWDHRKVLILIVVVLFLAPLCALNKIDSLIYNELEGRTPEKMNRVGRITTAVCVVVYASTAVSGYLLFGKDTESDILTNFDRDLGIRFSSAVNYVVRVGYVLHLVLVFPVIHFSLRETVDTLLFEGSPPLCESKKRSLGLTVVLLALIYIGSTMIPNIWTAFKFTGATSAVSLGFTFPALIALRLGKQSNSLSAAERSVSWLMLILAVVVSVVGTLGNVYSLRSKSD